MVAMFALFFITLVAFGLYHSDPTRSERSWKTFTPRERKLLAIAFSGVVQALLVTMIPGWVVAALLLGKGSFYETTWWGKELWAAVMTVSNTLIYYALIHFALNAVKARSFARSPLSIIASADSES